MARDEYLYELLRGETSDPRSAVPFSGIIAPFGMGNPLEDDLRVIRSARVDLVDDVKTLPGDSLVMFPDEPGNSIDFMQPLFAPSVREAIARRAGRTGVFGWRNAPKFESEAAGMAVLAMGLAPKEIDTVIVVAGQRWTQTAREKAEKSEAVLLYDDLDGADSLHGLVAEAGYSVSTVSSGTGPRICVSSDDDFEKRAATFVLHRGMPMFFTRALRDAVGTFPYQFAFKDPCDCHKLAEALTFDLGLPMFQEMADNPLPFRDDWDEDDMLDWAEMFLAAFDGTTNPLLAGWGGSTDDGKMFLKVLEI